MEYEVANGVKGMRLGISFYEIAVNTQKRFVNASLWILLKLIVYVLLEDIFLKDFIKNSCINMKEYFSTLLIPWNICNSIRTVCA